MMAMPAGLRTGTFAPRQKDLLVIFRARAMLSASTALLCGLSSCGIYHTKAYVPNSFTSLQTEDAATASTNCFESSTAVEKAACSVASLAPLNRALTETLQRDLRKADLFSRDALMAAQRAWLLHLPATCHLGESASAQPDPASIQCLSQQFQSQTAALAAWHAPRDAATGNAAIAQYVRFRSSAGMQGLNGPACAALARDANASLAQNGTVDPATFPGATEIAGSHGADRGSYGGRRYAVELHDANAYGSFAQRARTVSVDNAMPVLDAVSLGQLLQGRAENNGARFSSYASQTGDYGAIDVFVQGGRVVALLEDAWGFDTPAAPGEFAHAGAWDLTAGTPAPLCVFDTFKMPAEGGSFDQLPSFTPFQTTLAQIAASSQPALGVATLRDMGQLRAETQWMLLNMPLVVSQQAGTGGWTPWLRHRHDDVLDALFAWNTKDPANTPSFDRAFALLRPAAQDLVTAYQQTQALSGDEAKQAAGIAIMEMMYGATVSLAPALGADLAAPASAAGTKPRYPILASPN
jgi:uncharacterized protein YecT (DUF1311 family)